MTSHPSPLHPSNKHRYQDGERVEVALNGDVSHILTGAVIGLVSEHIIDHWIVLLDEPLPEWPYKAISVQHTFMRPDGSNEPFLCEGSARFG